MAGDFTRVIVVIREKAVCLCFIIIINSDNLSFLIDNISTCFIDFTYKTKTIAPLLFRTTHLCFVHMMQNIYKKQI